MGTPENTFTWVPFYEELAQKLVNYKDEQPALIEYLEKLRADGLAITTLQDEDEQGEKFLMTELDPFSFFGVFNRGITDDNRIRILEEVKKQFSIVANVPRDFIGAPVLQNFKSRFVAYSRDRKPEDVPILWEVFTKALGEAPFSDPEFGTLFDQALKIKLVNVNLTIGLYWIRPNYFVSLDKNLCTYFDVRIPKDGLSYSFYKATVEEISKKSDKSFVELSHEAWRVTQKSSSADIAKSTGYWKIAPGENARLWGDWQSESTISIGWRKFSEVKYTNRDDFMEFAKGVDSEKSHDGRGGAGMVWDFARKMQVGDRVVANKGQREILGVGTVEGEYYFDEGAEYPHKRAVRWDSTTPIPINESGWIRALQPLDKKKFEELIKGETVSAPTSLAEPFSKVFQDMDEANATLDLMRKILEGLGATGPEDKRIALNFRRDEGGKLHLNFGQWLVCGAYPPGGPYRLVVPLATDAPSAATLQAKGEFSGNEGEIVGLFGVTELPTLAFSEQFQEDLRSALHVGRTKFRTWRGTPYLRPTSLPNELLFDAAKRSEILTSGWEDAARPVVYPAYSLAQCAEDTYFNEDELERWVRAIERKKQAILYGPPGTGKTFIAEHLARHLVGGSDGFIETLQFHPAYGYEDFIQGIRPVVDEGGALNYEMVAGRFKEFCETALDATGTCVLILDEINRANLSRVFGELMYLLEYRNKTVPLAGGGDEFQIPENVRIIGTMNTADRSIALVDHALRRRFAFLRLAPNFDVLHRYHVGQDGINVEALIHALEEVNRAIDDGHYHVGISYFLRDDLADHLEDVWRMEIEPYLEEYFFDRPDSVDVFRWDRLRENILK